jgi:ATP-binding cassette subfamily G (WHITE) protein 2 (PDR)
VPPYIAIIAITRQTLSSVADSSNLEAILAFRLQAFGLAIMQSSSTTSFTEKSIEDKAGDEEQIHVSKLNYKLTESSRSTTQSLFPLQKDSQLDPNGSQFNPRAWAKEFLRLRTSISGGSPPRTTGVAWSDLNAYGFGSATDFQKNVGSVLLDGAKLLNNLLHHDKRRVEILRDFDGVVQQGEMLAVLGPPGSGCSTLLRTIAGDTYGFRVDANINYSGIHPKQMSSAFRGDAIYTAEVDDHFPHLTVGDTLYFAARARSPKNMPEGVSRIEYAEHLRDATMAMLGISHTKDTRVGDQYVRGVSGGERKRVTIAEAALSYAPLQCWDNSTRGLDSANAIEFCRALRTQADIMGTTSCVALYQAPQAAYEVSSFNFLMTMKIKADHASSSSTKWLSCTKGDRYTSARPAMQKPISKSLASYALSSKLHPTSSLQ